MAGQQKKKMTGPGWTELLDDSTIMMCTSLLDDENVPDMLWTILMAHEIPTW